MSASLVGSEMCIRDSPRAFVLAQRIMALRRAWYATPEVRLYLQRSLDVYKQQGHRVIVNGNGTPVGTQELEEP
eukprot:12771667-Alexandrium_andersonii.AAC.1